MGRKGKTIFISASPSKNEIVHRLELVVIVVFPACNARVVFFKPRNLRYSVGNLRYSGAILALLGKKTNRSFSFSVVERRI